MKGILINYKQVKKATEIELALKFKGKLPERKLFDKEYVSTY